jgi:hypothetical protein
MTSSAATSAATNCRRRPSERTVTKSVVNRTSLAKKYASAFGTTIQKTAIRE